MAHNLVVRRYFSGISMGTGDCSHVFCNKNKECMGTKEERYRSLAKPLSVSHLLFECITVPCDPIHEFSDYRQVRSGGANERLYAHKYAGHDRIDWRWDTRSSLTVYTIDPCISSTGVLQAKQLHH